MDISPDQVGRWVRRRGRPRHAGSFTLADGGGKFLEQILDGVAELDELAGLKAEVRSVDVVLNRAAKSVGGAHPLPRAPRASRSRPHNGSSSNHAGPASRHESSFACGQSADSGRLSRSIPQALCSGALRAMRAPPLAASATAVLRRAPVAVRLRTSRFETLRSQAETELGKIPFWYAR